MKVFFPGSFDPFTIGHANLVYRALNFADGIVIGIGVNSEKKSMFTPEQRLEAIKHYFEGEDKVEVITYSGLTATVARAKKCDAILRGVRDCIDFGYEQNIAHVNDNINSMETIMLVTRPQFQHISSSLSREMYKYTGNLEYAISEFKEYLNNGK